MANSAGLRGAETPQDLCLRPLAAERQKCSQPGGHRAPERPGLAGRSAEHTQQSRGQSCPKPRSSGQEGCSGMGQGDHTRGRLWGAQISAGPVCGGKAGRGPVGHMGQVEKVSGQGAGPEPVARGGQ